MLNIRLLLRGGLGNQLIQISYANYLASRCTSMNISVIADNILLGYGQSVLQGIKRRSSYDFVNSFNAQRQCKHLPLYCYSAAFLNLSRGIYIHDSHSEERVLRILSMRRKTDCIFMLGYFQRVEAFQLLLKHNIWAHFIRFYTNEYNSELLPHYEVACHVRLGDYLSKPSIYHINDPKAIIRRAIRLRDLCFAKYNKINVFTDDVTTLRRYIQDSCSIINDINIVSSDALSDMIHLSKHRLIIGSNSTFSLCAGFISSILHSHNSLLLLPCKWFIDEEMNTKEIGKWNDLKFIRFY